MTGPQIVEFSKAVSATFQLHELETVLKGLERRFIDYTAASVPFPNQVEQLVAAANSQGWILHLVFAVVRERQTSVMIQAFLRSNPDLDPARAAFDGDPCETLRVLGGKSFIGRKLLRNYLRKMNTTDGRKILVVTSLQRRVGKTYSRDLVDFLSLHRQPSDVIFLDLDKEDADLGLIAAKIASRLGRTPHEPPKPGQQQDPRWSQELIEWLIPPSDKSDKVWWIVLDGFREKLPTEGTCEFISQLAQRVQSTANFRLLLLNFTNPLPLTLFSFKDIVVPIVRDEVSDYLVKVHKRKHREEPSDEELTDYIDGVYERLDEYKRTYPKEADDHLLLNRAVSDATETILED